MSPQSKLRDTMIKGWISKFKMKYVFIADPVVSVAVVKFSVSSVGCAYGGISIMNSEES